MPWFIEWLLLCGNFGNKIFKWNIMNNTIATFDSWDEGFWRFINKSFLEIPRGPLGIDFIFLDPRGMLNYHSNTTRWLKTDGTSLPSLFLVKNFEEKEIERICQKLPSNNYNNWTKTIIFTECVVLFQIFFKINMRDFLVICKPVCSMPSM